MRFMVSTGRATILALLAFLFLPLAALAQQPGEPGRFDYWVLALSWSPAWCAADEDNRETAQCAGPRRYGFVVHGLWPQYEKGYPAFCPAIAGLPDDLVDAMLPVMPSERLIFHQWSKHGSCSGLSPEAYFATLRRAFDRLSVPPALDRPDRAMRVTAERLEALLAEANPGLSDEAVAVVCRRRELAEIRICLDRDDLDFRSCGADVDDRCRGEVTVRPVR